MEHKVCFLYRTGQEVWYIHKTKNIPSHGYIQEININISYMGQSDYMDPIIKYLIHGNWYVENELWDNKENFKTWYNNHFCCTKELKFEHDNAIWENIDNLGTEVKVIGLISRTNNSHPLKKMKIAEIFYFNRDNKPKFRYVPLNDIIFINEPSNISKNKYELLKEYGEYYVEDDIYNFVNYDGIKLY